MIKKDGTAKSIQDDFDETIDANDFICSTDLNEKIFEEKNDELMDIETLDMNDFAYSQLEALKVLNELFHLLKIEPVNDIRHTNKLREKLDSVNIALNNLCETILNKKEQQIQLLTIAPPIWGRKKIEYYFGCTEHQSKQAILSRKSHGILARPVFFSGNSPIQKATIDQMVQFYEDDKINRQFSNKKDRIKSWNKRSDTKWNIEQLIKSLLCTSSTEQCYSQKCGNCRDKFTSCILTKTDSEYSNVEDDEISWFNWVRTLGKIHLQEIHSDVSTLIGTIDEQCPVLLN
ncbi:unnamed protein product, partial [Rotaria sordida]